MKGQLSDTITHDISYVVQISEDGQHWENFSLGIPNLEAVLGFKERIQAEMPDNKFRIIKAEYTAMVLGE